MVIMIIMIIMVMMAIMMIMAIMVIMVMIVFQPHHAISVLHQNSLFAQDWHEHLNLNEWNDITGKRFYFGKVKMNPHIMLRSWTVSNCF